MRGLIFASPVRQEDIQFGLWLEFDRGTEYATNSSRSCAEFCRLSSQADTPRCLARALSKSCFRQLGRAVGPTERVKQMRQWARDVLKITHEKGDV